jgi:hypothetical protein
MRFLKVAVATFALTISFFSTSINAEVIDNLLFGGVTQGPYTGASGSGTFSYDDSLLTHAGVEILFPDEFFLEFAIFGQTFFGTDEIEYPLYPRLWLFDGTPDSIEFNAIYNPGLFPGTEEPSNPVFIELFPLTQVGPGVFFSRVGADDYVAPVAAVPVPATVWLFGSSLIGLVGVARRKKA